MSMYKQLLRRDQWNEDYPVGTPVRYRHGEKRREAVTASAARLEKGRDGRPAAVVDLAGHRRPMRLDRVWPDWEKLKAARAGEPAGPEAAWSIEPM